MSCLRRTFTYLMELMSEFTSTQLLFVASSLAILVSYTFGIWVILICWGTFFGSTELLKRAHQKLPSVAVRLLRLFESRQEPTDYTVALAEIDMIRKKIHDEYIKSWSSLVDINPETVEVMETIVDEAINGIVSLVRQDLLTPEALFADLIESAHHHLQKLPDRKTLLSSTTVDWQDEFHTALGPLLKGLSLNITQILHRLVTYRAISATERAVRDILFENIVVALIDYLCQQENMLKIVILIFADDSDNVLANCVVPQDQTSTPPTFVDALTDENDTVTFELEQSFHDAETDSSDSHPIMKNDVITDAELDAFDPGTKGNHHSLEQPDPHDNFAIHTKTDPSLNLGRRRSHSFEVIETDTGPVTESEEYISENLSQFFKVEDSSEKVSISNNIIADEISDNDVTSTETGGLKGAANTADMFYVAPSKLIAALRDKTSSQPSLGQINQSHQSVGEQPETLPLPTLVIPASRLTSAFKRPELASAMSRQSFEAPSTTEVKTTTSVIPAALLTSAFKIADQRIQGNVSSEEEGSLEGKSAPKALLSARQAGEDDKSSVKDSTSTDSGHGKERRFHSVYISSTLTHSDRSKGQEYTLYCIEYQATYPDEGSQEPRLDHGRVLRRYREFCNLVARLERSPKYARYVKRMKGPSLWQQALSLGNRNKRQQEIKKRRSQLDTFLTQLIDCEEINTCSDLAEFLAYNSGDAQIEFVKEKVEIIPKKARIDKLLVKTVSGMLEKVSDKMTVNTTSPDPRPVVEYTHTGQDVDGYLVALADESENCEDLLSLDFELHIDQYISLQRAGDEPTGMPIGAEQPDAAERTERHPLELSALTEKLVELVLLLLQPHLSLANNAKVLYTFRPTITLLVSHWLRGKISYLTEPNKVASLLKKAQNAIWPADLAPDVNYDLHKLKASAKDSILQIIPRLATPFVHYYISLIYDDLIPLTADDKVNKVLIIRAMERALSHSAKDLLER